METKSPYSEPLPRPRSASPTRSGSDTHRSATQRSKSAKTRSTSDKNNQRKKKGKTKHVDENEREIRLVSKEVKNKLELYLNKEKREIRFRPDGAIATTRKMAPFDVAYRLMEYEKMEKQSSRNPKSGRQNNNTSSRDPYNIQPNLVENSRRVTQYTEADRFSKYASEVFASYPIEKLAVIHRYRPHPIEHKKKSAENGNVLGYTGHVGAALHQKAYVDFYIKEGFNSNSSSQSSKSAKKSSKQSKSSNSKNTHGERKNSNTSTMSTSSSKGSSKKKPNKDNAKESSNHEQEKSEEKSQSNNEDGVIEADVINGNDKRCGSKHKEQHTQNSTETNEDKSSHSNSSYKSSSNDDDVTNTEAREKRMKKKKISKTKTEGPDEVGKEKDDKSTETGDRDKAEDICDKADDSGDNRDKSHSKNEGDNKSLKSYVSVEHVLEVDIKDI